MNAIPWRRLARLVRPEARALSLATLCLVVSAAIALSVPQAARLVVDRAADGAPWPSGLASAALALLLLQALTAALRTWLFTLAGERLVLRLREQVFGHLLALDTAFFDERRTGELLTRLGEDTTAVRNALTVDISHGLRHLLGALGGTVILVVTSPKLAAAMGVLLPVLGIGTALHGRHLRRLSRSIADAAAGAGEVAEETLAAIRTVRTLGREDWAQARYAASTASVREAANRRARAVGAFVGGTTLVRLATVGGIVVLGLREVELGRMSLGDLTAFVAYAAFVAVSLGSLTHLWGEYMKAAGSSQRVFALLDEPVGIERSGSATPIEPKGQLTLQDVWFAYPSRPGVLVLDGLDLTLAPGERVALVGPSGCGKSTVAALVSRLYDPDAGSIRVDGVDLRDLCPRQLRRHIGVVRQEPTLFATTIRDNLRLGDPEATDADLEAAARAANAHQFIVELPDGYDTAVGERGVLLSGGQKQRIAIARALLEDPAVLILDEATSALDADNETVVRQAIARLMEGRTTLIITHRPDGLAVDRVVRLSGSLALAS